MDTYKHVVSITGGRLRLSCELHADVFVGYVHDGSITEVDDGPPKLDRPLFVDCDSHGKYLGLWQLLRKGPPTDTSHNYSMSLLMFPLPTPEVLSPLQTARTIDKLVAEALAGGLDPEALTPESVRFLLQHFGAGK